MKKIADLTVGETYYVSFAQDKQLARKATLLGIVNEFENQTELYFNFAPIYVIGIGYAEQFFIVRSDEMWIGKSKEKRYKYPQFEAIANAFKSFDLLLKSLKN